MVILFETTAMLYKKLIIITIAIITVILLGLAATFTAYYYGWLGSHFNLIKTNFALLPGWERDNHNQALETFAKSCEAIKKRNSQTPFSKKIPAAGTVADWQKICVAINQIDKKDEINARQFFEFWFEPYRVCNNFNTKGLFTGYYLPTLKCSLTQDENYIAPIYALPSDWVRVDLGLFDAKLNGRRITGQVKNHRLYPYPNQEAINRGAINKTAKVLAWCDSFVDVAFAHIQGSAIVQLPNQETFLIGYDASNGRTYTSIAKTLIQNKAFTRQNSSMQTLRAWFLQHPEKIKAILNKNASYVFFRKLKHDAPLGSQQVPLTPQRSLAVDTRYIPLGSPVWLDTIVLENTQQGSVPFKHLLIAQDTGGAIKGIIRGDIYWGGGKQAAFSAGNMKNQGSYWILLPRFK